MVGCQSSAKVLILTSSTGSGHDSTAQALVDALQARLANAAVTVWDPLSCDLGWLAAIWPPSSIYNHVAGRAPTLWKHFYHLTNRPWVVQLGVRLALLLWGRRLWDRCAIERPDLVISVHPLCAQMASRVLCRLPRRPLHYCVVTDLVSVHRCWAADVVDVFCAPTRQAGRALVAIGIPQHTVQVTGLPLRQAFTQVPSTRGCSRRRRVLLLGGGHAAPALERAVHALLSSPISANMTVVCGRNTDLYRRLVRLGGERLVVQAWRDDIAGLMRAADVVVTKAGSVTLAEAFSQGRPVIVYHHIPGQETGNLSLLRDGCDRYVPCPEALPAAVEEALRWPAPAAIQHEAGWWRSGAGRVAGHIAAHLAGAAAPRKPSRGPMSRARPMRCTRRLPNAVRRPRSYDARPDTVD